MGRRERAGIDDPDVEARLGRWATELEVAQLLEQRVTWMEPTARCRWPRVRCAKLFSTEAIVRRAEELTELVGPDALRSRLDPTALADGRIEHGLRFSLGTHHLRGDQRDPAQHHRPAGLRPPSLVDDIRPSRPYAIHLDV